MASAPAPTSADGWFTLGYSTPLGKQAVVLLGGDEAASLSERECYLRALRIDPTHMKAWFCLGDELLGTETWLVRRAMIDRQIDDVDKIRALTFETLEHAVVDEDTIVFADDCFLRCAELIDNDRDLAHGTRVANTVAVYARLAQHLVNHGTVAPMGRAKLRGFEMALSTLITSQTLSADYGPLLLLAADQVQLHGGESLSLGGNKFVVKDLFGRALSTPECNQDARAWLTAALFLVGQPIGLSGFPPAVNVLGKWISPIECVVRAASLDPSLIRAFMVLAVLMRGRHEPVMLLGKEMKLADVLGYIAAQRPNDADAWVELGNALVGGGGTYSIDGEALTASDCYRRAIAAKPTYARGWYRLAVAVKQGEHVDVQGTPHTQTSLLTIALTLDSKSGAAWDVLGCAIRDSGVGRVTVSGEVITERECYLRAIERDPRFPDSYTHLAQVLAPDERVSLSSVCATRVELDHGVVVNYPQSTAAWRCLGEALLDAERITPTVAIIGQHLSAADCFAQALARSGSRDAASWLGLIRATAVDPITIGDASTQISRLDCFVKALSFSDGHFPDCWTLLGDYLQSQPYGLQEFFFEGRNMSPRDCWVKALSQAKLTRPRSVIAAGCSLAHDMDHNDIVTFPAPPLVANQPPPPASEWTKTQLLTLCLDLYVRSPRGVQYPLTAVAQRAWGELVELLLPGQTALINGIPHTQADCQAQHRHVTMQHAAGIGHVVTTLTLQ
jgi:tetratricopeptide (TPR) repeat protein